MAENDKTLENIISALGSGTGVDTTGESDFYRELEKLSKETETLADKENKEIIEMRHLWSTWVLGLIVTIVIFDIILVTLYGFGIWNFEDSNVVMVIVTENFLKIIGLGILITNSIFKKIF